MLILVYKKKQNDQLFLKIDFTFIKKKNPLFMEEVFEFEKIKRPQFI